MDPWRLNCYLLKERLKKVMEVISHCSLFQSGKFGNKKGMVVNRTPCKDEDSSEQFSTSIDQPIEMKNNLANLKITSKDRAAKDSVFNGLPKDVTKSSTNSLILLGTQSEVVRKPINRLVVNVLSDAVKVDKKKVTGDKKSSKNCDQPKFLLSTHVNQIANNLVNCSISIDTKGFSNTGVTTTDVTKTHLQKQLSKEDSYQVPNKVSQSEDQYFTYSLETSRVGNCLKNNSNSFITTDITNEVDSVTIPVTNNVTEGMINNVTHSCTSCAPPLIVTSKQNDELKSDDKLKEETNNKVSSKKESFDLINNMRNQITTNVSNSETNSKTIDVTKSMKHVVTNCTKINVTSIPSEYVTENTLTDKVQLNTASNETEQISKDNDFNEKDQLDLTNKVTRDVTNNLTNLVTYTNIVTTTEMSDVTEDLVYNLTNIVKNDLTNEKTKVTKNLTDGIINNVTNEVTNVSAKDDTNIVTKELTNNGAKEVPKVLSSNVTKEVTNNVTKVMTEDVTNNVTKEETNNVTKEKAKDVTKNETKEMAKDVTKDVTSNSSEFEGRDGGEVRKRRRRLSLLERRRRRRGMSSGNVVQVSISTTHRYDDYAKKLGRSIKTTHYLNLYKWSSFCNSHHMVD